MSEPLVGVRLKTDRARHHLDAIDATLNNFIKVHLQNVSLFGQVDPTKSGWQVIRWENVPHLDQGVCAVVGDFAHNARSALDHMAWSLVLANGAKPGKHTHWPVAETEGKWRDDVLERNIERRGSPATEGLSDDAFKLVENFQPYRRAKRRREIAPDPLVLLRHLSNEDKHRTLHVGHFFVTEGPNGTYIDPPGYLAIAGLQKPERPLPVQKGTDFLRVKLRRVAWPPPEGVQVKMDWASLGVHVGFYAGDKYILSWDDLKAIAVRVEAIYLAVKALPEVVGH